MVNKSKSKSDAATVELREKLIELEAQQVDMAGRLASEIGKLVGTLTVEMAKLQYHVLHEMSKNYDGLMSAVNVLAGDIRKLRTIQTVVDAEVTQHDPVEGKPVEPAPKSNGEKPLLPRLTPDLIPPEGEHLIEYIGEMGIAKTGNHTVKMRFNGTEYVYFLNEQRNTIIKERTERGAPVHVKRGVWDKEPVVEFCWR